MPNLRTLIFCFDGTANDPEDAGDFSENGSITNILKLHALFGGGVNSAGPDWRETPHGHAQCSFYYSGVGTYGGRIRKWFNSALAPRNLDVGRIIRAGLADFGRAYQPRDRILIFGFSRGAAIARVFAAKIARERKKKVAFLGVFDTVAAIGGVDLRAATRPASDVVFENGTLHRNVQCAVHLVALDELRVAFQPTLFNHDRERILEVWLPGAHSDVGGGFWYDGLSDIALQFMLNRIAARFTHAPVHVIPPADIDYDRLNAGEDTDETRIVRDDLEINPIAYGKSHVQQRMKPLRRLTLHHRLLCVNENDKASRRKTPLVHQSVQERFSEVAGYRPIALRNRKYWILDNDGKPLGRRRTGIAGLRS